MIHNYLHMDLAALAEELKLFVGASPFSLRGVRSFVPAGDALKGKVVVPGHDGCYLNLTSGRNLSTITFELVLVGAAIGRPEALAVEGQFVDVRLPDSRYKAWFNSPYGNPHMLDIYDRVDRMAAYALLELEKAAQAAVGSPDFKLIPLIPAADLYAVMEYFRVPVQLDCD
jgi:hypothetical protein